MPSAIERPEVAALVSLLEVMAQSAPETPLAAIQDFNQRGRDAWVAARAAEIPPGSNVLDVGAGPCPYRALFSDCRYETHDFTAYEGYRDSARGEGLYGAIDHVSDILALPVADGAFDVVLCTEVLEHVPEPIRAVGEMARVLKSGGVMILTAPLGAGLHQEPYHFYGGYTPHWYAMVANRFGLTVGRIEPNGGFFKHLAQECARVTWTMDKHRAGHGSNADAVALLFGELLPRYLYALDERFPEDGFTVGFHVVLRKG